MQLHLSNLVSKTHSLASTKWHEMFWFVKFALLGEKSFRSEFFRLIPDLGVHVDSVQERNDVSVLGDDVTLQLNSSE